LSNYGKEELLLDRKWWGKNKKEIGPVKKYILGWGVWNFTHDNNIFDNKEVHTVYRIHVQWKQLDVVTLELTETENSYRKITVTDYFYSNLDNSNRMITINDYFYSNLDNSNQMITITAYFYSNLDNSNQKITVTVYFHSDLL
jgi:hypothetical protein